MATRSATLPSAATSAALLALLLSSTAASAVDVRQPQTGAQFLTGVAKAYAQCVAPNTVSRNGLPACDPPVTSACHTNVPMRLSFTPQEFFPDPTEPTTLIILNDGPPTGVPQICRDGQFEIALVVRTTTDIAPQNDPDAPETPPCSSRHCTFPDFTVGGPSPFIANFLDANGDRDPNYEILSASITAPDGLPAGAFGIDRSSTDPFITNLTVPYAPCTAPEPAGACNLDRPLAACDFTSGEIEWPRLGPYGLPSAHVVLRDVAGVDPLCTTGTYHLEATLRVTGRACGTSQDPVTCTVADQTVTVPLSVKGHSIDTTVPFNLGPLGRYIETQLENVGILSARIIDPTGTAIAVPGVTGVRNLRKMRVGIKGDRLRVRAIIPVNENAPAIDPTLAGGATVTVSDRDGTFYSVTIPELLWQDQSPIGSRWTYADPGGVVGGVQKATIKRLGKEGDLKGYKLDLQAAGRDLSGADFPSMTVAVAVARPEDLVFGFPSIHRAQGHCSGTIKGPKVDCK